MNEHEIAAMWEQFGAEHPHLEPTDRNGEALIRWVVENGGLINIESLRVAAKVLANELERVPPPPPVVVPPAPPPAEPTEQLESWQIPLTPVPSSYTLAKASKAAVADYLKRAREAAGINFPTYPSHRRSQEKF